MLEASVNAVLHDVTIHSWYQWYCVLKEIDYREMTSTVKSSLLEMYLQWSILNILNIRLASHWKPQPSVTSIIERAEIQYWNDRLTYQYSNTKRLGWTTGYSAWYHYRRWLIRLAILPVLQWLTYPVFWWRPWLRSGGWPGWLRLFSVILYLLYSEMTDTLLISVFDLTTYLFKWLCIFWYSDKWSTVMTCWYLNLKAIMMTIYWYYYWWNDWYSETTVETW